MQKAQSLRLAHPRRGQGPDGLRGASPDDDRPAKAARKLSKQLRDPPRRGSFSTSHPLKVAGAVVTKHSVSIVLCIIALAMVIIGALAANISATLLGAWLVAASSFLLASSAEPLLGTRQARSGSFVESSARDIQFQLAQLATVEDPLFRNLIGVKLADIAGQLKELAQGQVVFHGTEGWRTAYEELLLSKDLGEYRSVAWIKSADYWRDQPGEHSLRANFLAVDAGLQIDRICILGWNLWPPEAILPHASFCRWIDDQHYRGLAVWLVRESSLANEPELLRDFGIYGERAVGEQNLDEESRTIRFTLSFDHAAVLLARQRWERLLLFSENYSDLVDRAGLGR